MPSLTPQKIEEIEPLLLALQNELGVVVPDGKRSQLLQNLTPLLSSYGFSSTAELAERLQQQDSAELKSNVLDVITRCYSDWSLSEELRRLLHKYILAQLNDNARIWVVGCGQGQLAYSVAMEIANHERISSESKNIQIIASDIPMADVESAEKGIYSNLEISYLNEEYKRLYLSKLDSESWQIKEKVRQQVSFKQCELTSDFQFIGHVDLIICPDILVYFSNEVKVAVLSQFSSLLKPGGVLLTGHNQLPAPDTSGFERVEHSAGIFYRQKA